jgi:secreted trypsin-like serine protease
VVFFFIINTCLKGDSGGPFVCYVDNHWVLVGIVSWGEGCAWEGAPELFASVPHFNDWIQRQIAEHTDDD